jgi:succinoglycan biosynthesis protein ExoA
MESTPQSAEGGLNLNGNVDCSVLVPVLNEERHIRDSVAAMRAQRFGGQLEFVLVEGPSTDRTGEILRELADRDSRIRLFHSPSGATPSSLNIALRHARGKWVARMDSHTEYPHDYLALAVQRLARGDTTWVSGPQMPRGRGRVSRAVALALRGPLGRGASRKWASEREADQAEYELDAGVFCGVWERDAVLRHGGWDEEWVRNQDSEMAGRFLASGERLICIPAMAASYTPRDSLRSLWRQYVEYGRYRFKTAVRHPATLRRSHLLAPGIVVTTGIAGLGPEPLRRLARGGLLLYAGTLLAAGVGSRPHAEQPADALLVPVVLAVMHFGHGAGALIASVTDGPPLAALLRIAGLRGVADRMSPGRTRVYAPSLSVDDSE